MCLSDDVSFNGYTGRMGAKLVDWNKLGNWHNMTHSLDEPLKHDFPDLFVRQFAHVGHAIWSDRPSRPQKALCGGIPDPYLEPLTRCWSHFVGIYRQILTTSLKK